MFNIDIMIRDFSIWGLKRMKARTICIKKKHVFLNFMKCFVGNVIGKKKRRNIKMANHIIAIRKTIKFEGGYVNDPADPGGETKYGISSRQYPDIDISMLTVEDAFAIYKKDYWDKLSLDNCESQVIANELFDTAVNMGVHKAAIILQGALNVCSSSDLVIDGLIGPRTIEALNIYVIKWGPINKVNESILLKTLDGLQFMHYWDIVENDTRMKRFFRGWINQRIGNEGEE